MLMRPVALDIQFRDEVYIEWPMLIASVRTSSAALEGLAGDQLIDQSYRGSIRDMISRRKRNQ